MEDWKPVRSFCRNCGHLMSGYKNSKGVVKITCSNCGSCSISRMVSRRHERCDTYAPPGLAIMEEN